MVDRKLTDGNNKYEAPNIVWPPTTNERLTEAEVARLPSRLVGLLPPSGGLIAIYLLPCTRFGSDVYWTASTRSSSPATHVAGRRGSNLVW